MSDQNENSGFNIEGLSAEARLRYVLCDSAEEEASPAAAVDDLVGDLRLLTYALDTEWADGRAQAAMHVAAIMRRAEAVASMVRDEHSMLFTAQHAVHVLTQERDALKARIEKLEGEIENAPGHARDEGRLERVRERFEAEKKRKANGKSALKMEER